MMENMQLHGLSKGTQKVYASAIRRLAEHYGKSPDRITEEELRKYFLYLTYEKQVGRSTCTITLCAVKFLYEYTLQREWPTLKLVRPSLPDSGSCLPVKIPGLPKHHICLWFAY
jgi:site-specific recombinase XerD